MNLNTKSTTSDDNTHLNFCCFFPDDMTFKKVTRKLKGIVKYQNVIVQGHYEYKFKCKKSKKTADYG